MFVTDMQDYSPLNTTNTTAHGGRMSASRIISGVNSNVFPPIFSADRIALTVHQQKLFRKINDDADGTAYNCRLFYVAQPAGDDFAKFWAGTQRDTRADITGSETFFTSGVLQTGVAASETTISVIVKNAALAAGFHANGLVVVSSKVLPSSTAGTLEVMTINSSAPTVVGNVVTMTFTAGLANAYLAGATISSVYSAGDIACSISGTGHTGGADVDFDEITLDNIGTVDEDWVATFTSSTAYNLVGDSLGLVGSGVVGSTFSPLHATFAKPMLNIPATAFTALTIAAGDTFSFSTHPPAIPIWEEKTNPANAAETSSNYLWLWMIWEAVSA